MGQYWKVVNLDKQEFVSPHVLGCGLKLWEQLANHPGTGAALIVLCAAMPEARGGGDFDLDANWHGPEREEAMKTGKIDGRTPGPMPEEYPAVAKRTIGRWAGDRIALVGDYAEADDVKGADASQVYARCCVDSSDWAETLRWFKEHNPAQYEDIKKCGPYKDVSADVARVIEHELNGHYDDGRGFREFKYGKEEKATA